MILKKQQKSDDQSGISEAPNICELRFGVSGLNNSSLIERLFPEDLPEEWRLSYYSNEFTLLLIHLSDLTMLHSPSQEQSSLSTDEIIEQLAAVNDEVEDDMLLLFDVSKFSEDSRQQFYKSSITADKNCYFINLNKRIDDRPTGLSIRLEWGNLIAAEGITIKAAKNLFCLVTSEQRIAPVELRKLIEHLRDYATKKNCKAVNVVFSSSHNALENCRDAIMLESMM